MSDDAEFPQFITLRKSARTFIAAGMRTAKFISTRPFCDAVVKYNPEKNITLDQVSVEEWLRTRDRIIAQLNRREGRDMIVILSKLEYIALVEGVGCNPCRAPKFAGVVKKIHDSAAKVDVFPSLYEDP